MNLTEIGPSHCKKTRWGSGGIDPFIHNLCSRWRCVAGFKPQLLYRWGRIPRCTLNRRLWRQSISGLGQPFAWKNWVNPQGLHHVQAMTWTLLPTWPAAVYLFQYKQYWYCSIQTNKLYYWQIQRMSLNMAAGTECPSWCRFSMQ